MTIYCLFVSYSDDDIAFLLLTDNESTRLPMSCNEEDSNLIHGRDEDQADLEKLFTELVTDLVSI